MKLEPKNPAFEQRCLESWEKQRFMHRIGATMETVEPGLCEIHLTMHPDLEQSHGFASGSVLGALADVSGGYAAYTLCPADMTMLTVEYKINFLRPAAGPLLVGRGICEKAGSSLSVSRAEVYNVKNDIRTLVATAQMTMASLPEEDFS